MAEHYRLSAASSADIAELAALEQSCFPDPWTEEQLGEALTWLGNVTLVARDDRDAIQGYLLGRVVAGEAEVLSFAVRPEHRGIGLGRQLLQAAFTQFRERAADTVWLEVRESNTAARALYERFGFTAVGARRDYYRNPDEDAVVLRCDLAPGLA